MYKNRLIYVVYAVIIVMIVTIMTNISVDLFPKKNEKTMFPGILGDSILKNNDTGIYFIKSMTLYDDFRGNIVQGYKANYSGVNGTIVIFIAQMLDNVSANRSLKDMVTRLGYNQSSDNLNLTYNSVIKLPVENPEVFVIQKNETRYHYTFSKEDKIYWVGFSNIDVQYQVDMLIEIYKNVDKKDDGNIN